MERTTLSGSDGEPIELTLLPGMSEVEIQRLEEGLPCRIPAKIRELLGYCRGFGADYEVDFSGSPDFGFDDGFPHGHPIAHDGCGNYWVVDLFPSSPEWGPIYYASHDPPVILYLCNGVETFLQEMLNGMRPPHKSLVDDVRSDTPFDVWRTNPGVMTQAEAASSADLVLAGVARELEPDWQMVDLRGAPPGMGFSWGRYRADTEVVRCGDEPIFAYRKAAPKPGFFQRLLKR